MDKARLYASRSEIAGTYLAIIILLNILFNFIFIPEQLIAQENRLIFEEEVQKIVNEEVSRAFKKYEHSGDFSASELANKIIPMISDAVVKRSTRLLMERGRVDTEENLILAEVLGRPITVKDIKEELKRLPPEQKIKLLAMADFNTFLVDTYVTKILINEEAKKKDVESLPEVKRHLRWLRENILIDSVISRKKAEIGSTITISELDLKEWYENQDSTRFTDELEYKIRHILISPEDTSEKALEAAEKKINTIYDALTRGLDFIELAEKESMDRNASGGLLGYFKAEELATGPMKVVLRLSKGQFSKPVQASDGFHIYRVDDIIGGRVRTLQEVRKELEEEIYRVRLNDEIDAYIDSLRSQANIELLKDNIAKAEKYLTSKGVLTFISDEEKSEAETGEITAIEDNTSTRNTGIAAPVIPRKERSDEVRIENIPESEMLSLPLARVSGYPITLQAAMDEIDMMPEAGKEQVQYEGLATLVHTLIDRHLLLLEARKMNVECDPEVASKYQDARSRYIAQFMIRKFVKSVEKSDIKAEYERTKKLIRARHILFKADFKDPVSVKRAREKAFEVLAELKAGKDFATLAARYSECPSKDTGGLLSPFRRGMVDEEFFKAADATEPGQVTGPVRTEFGFHIIKVEGTTELAFEKVEGEIKAALREQNIRRWLESLRKDAEIKLYEENIKSALERKLLEK